MAKYQKGNLILDEATVGAKTSEDWASQGFSRVEDAPVAPATPTTPTPTAPAPVAPGPAPVNTENEEKATLYNPQTGTPTVVTVGSPEASNLQSKGWTLTKPATPTAPAPANAFTPPAGYEAIPAPGLIKNYSAHITSPDGKTMYGIPINKTTSGAVDNPVPTGGMNADIAGGIAGAGGSLSDFNTIAGVTNPITDPILTQVYNELGIPDLVNSAFAKPQTSTVQLFNDSYKDSGLGELKTKIAEKMDELAKTKEDLNQATGKIADNPWLSESSRVGRTKRLTELAQGTIDNLTGEINNLSSLYSSGVQEINDKVTRTTNDFQTEATLNTAKLNYLLKQAEVKLGIKQDENLAKAYENLPDYLKNVVTDTNAKVFGGVSTGYYIYNEKTGGFDQIVAPANSGGSGGFATGTPNSYKEWTLAGKPGEYADWIAKTGAKPIEAELLRADINDMTAEVQKVLGSDGFMIPSDYDKAKKAWVISAQRKPSEFDDYFSVYRDPENFNYNLD